MIMMGERRSNTLYPEIPRGSQCMVPVISGICSLFLTKFPPTPFPDILKGIYMPPVILLLKKNVFDNTACYWNAKQ